jgi:transposase
MPTTAARMSPWTDTFYLTCYQLARDGFRDGKIAETIGVSYKTFRKWRREKDALRDALSRARETDRGGQTWKSHVYGKLSEDGQKCWDKIHEWQDEPNGIKKIRKMLDKQGMPMRQTMFLHGLFTGNFSVSAACRKIGISRQVFEGWVKRDHEFQTLVEEVLQAQKDFYEESLVKACKQGQASAIIFANRTKNRDRGYNEKLEIDNNQNSNLSVMDIDVLDLPVDVRKAILDAVRKRQRELELDALNL